MYPYGILVCMKTTMNLKDDLVRRAMEATGIKEKTALVHLGLEELVKKAAYKRLIALGGTDIKAKAAPRGRTGSGNAR
jgi:Arc/MetJ family transcription regulator